MPLVAPTGHAVTFQENMRDTVGEGVARNEGTIVAEPRYTDPGDGGGCNSAESERQEIVVRRARKAGEEIAVSVTSNILSSAKEGGLGSACQIKGTGCNECRKYQFTHGGDGLTCCVGWMGNTMNARPVEVNKIRSAAFAVSRNGSLWPYR